MMDSEKLFLAAFVLLGSASLYFICTSTSYIYHGFLQPVVSELWRYTTMFNIVIWIVIIVVLLLLCHYYILKNGLSTKEIRCMICNNEVLHRGFNPNYNIQWEELIVNKTQTETILSMGHANTGAMVINPLSSTSFECKAKVVKYFHEKRCSIYNLTRDRTLYMVEMQYFNADGKNEPTMKFQKLNFITWYTESGHLQKQSVDPSQFHYNFDYQTRHKDWTDKARPHTLTSIRCILQSDTTYLRKACNIQAHGFGNMNYLLHKYVSELGW